VNNGDELVTVDDFSYGCILVRELGLIELIGCKIFGNRVKVTAATRILTNKIFRSKNPKNVVYDN
jgi:hypothetical protein